MLLHDLGDGVATRNTHSDHSGCKSDRQVGTAGQTRSRMLRRIRWRGGRGNVVGTERRIDDAVDGALRRPRGRLRTQKRQDYDGHCSEKASNHGFPPSAAAGSRYWFSLPPLARYKRGQVSLKSPKESRDERWLSWPSVSAANETPDGPYPKRSE